MATGHPAGAAAIERKAGRGQMRSLSAGAARAKAPPPPRRRPFVQLGRSSLVFECVCSIPMVSGLQSRPEGSCREVLPAAAPYHRPGSARLGRPRGCTGCLCTRCSRS